MNNRHAHFTVTGNYNASAYMRKRSQGESLKHNQLGLTPSIVSMITQVKLGHFLTLLSALLLVISVHSQQLSGVAISSAENGLHCSPGFLYNTKSSICECYPSSNVRCSGHKALLNFGSCMTYREGEGTFIGFCISFLARGRNVTDRVYVSLPDNITELNDYMCGVMNRKGLVCSECMEGFSPAMTSIGFQCSNCSGVWYGVPLYLLLEFVPITIFYVFIVSSGISVTSAPMSSFVLYCQLAAHLFTSFTTLTAVIENEYGTAVLYFIEIITSLCAIWNLDFFRYVIPPFCISPHLKLLHIFVLYYISAFYPLCLIGITWILIELQSRSFKPLTWLWYRIKVCCCCKRNIKVSKLKIVDVFASFFLLSYTKLLYTSFYFLIYLHIEKNGSPFRLVSGIDPSFGYFSKEHAIFALFAILILIGPVLVPVLILTFYPVKAFRSLLDCLKISGRSRVALNQFVEKFHSCYRDGLKSNRDMRSFVVLPFILRSLVFLGIVFQDQVLFWFFYFLLFGGACLLVSLVRPYKKNYMNVIDSLILAILSLIGVYYILYLFLTHDYIQHSLFFLVLLFMNFILPLVGITIVIITKMFKTPRCMRFRIFHFLSTAIDRPIDIYSSQPLQHLNSTTDLDFPDRILHPYRYAEEQSDDN